jgi:hypothetical protein
MHLSATMRATCLVHPIILDMIILVILGVEYKLRSSSINSLLEPPIISPLLGPLFSSAPCSQNPSVSDVIPPISETKFRTQSHEKILRNVSPAATT